MLELLENFLEGGHDSDRDNKFTCALTDDIEIHFFLITNLLLNIIL